MGARQSSRDGFRIRSWRCVSPRPFPGRCCDVGLRAVENDARTQASADGQEIRKKLKHQARSRKIESLIMERGQAGTKDYRVHVLAKGEEDMTVAELSLWHD